MSRGLPLRSSGYSRRGFIVFWTLLFALSLLLNSVAMVAAPNRALGASVTPILLEGAANLTCAELAVDHSGGQTWLEAKQDPNADGTIDVFEVGTITISNTQDDKTFDWSSTFGIDAVYVKGGSDGSYLYVYAPTLASQEALGDTGLTTPGVNAISHISFCYDVGTISFEKKVEGGSLGPGDFDLWFQPLEGDKVTVHHGDVVAAQPGRYLVGEEGPPEPYALTSIICAPSSLAGFEITPVADVTAPNAVAPGSVWIGGKSEDGEAWDWRCTITNTAPTPDAGSLMVAKALAGGPEGYAGPFTVNWDCDGVAHDGSASVAAGAPAVLADGGIPIGTSCTVSETLPPPPTGYSFGTPTFSPSATVTIETRGQVVTVTTSNVLIRDQVPRPTPTATIPSLGNLVITKVVSTATAFPGGTFTFDTTCAGQRTITLAAGQATGSVTVSNLTAGTSCTVTELSPLPDAGTGWSWAGSPQYAPGQTVTIPLNSTATVTVTNFRGEVQAATATPRVTLPPTDTLGNSGPSSSGLSLWAILMVLSGFMVVVGLFTPTPDRIRRRKER